MNKKMVFICSLLLVMMHGGSSILCLEKLLGTTHEQPLYTITLDRQLTALEKDKQQLASYVELRARREKIAHDIVQLKDRLKHVSGIEHDFLSKKLSLFGQSYQVLTELEAALTQIGSLIDEHIGVVQSYKADPDFKALKMPVKASYGFDDLQEKDRKLLGYKGQLSELEKNKITATDDVNKRMRTLNAILEEYKDKKKQQEAFGVSLRPQTVSGEGFTVLQQGALLDEHNLLLKYKKELAELKVKEAEYRVAFIDTRLAILRGKLSVIKEDYTHIKRALNVDVAYVKHAEAKLEEKRQAAAGDREKLFEKIRILQPVREDLKKRIEEVVHIYNLSSSEATAIKEWNRAPHTKLDWMISAKLGNLYAQESLITTDQEYAEASTELIKANLRLHEIEFDTIRSWHTMTHRMYRANLDQAIAKEIRHYEVPRAELQADLVALTEKRNATINLLHTLNVMLNKVKGYIQELKSYRETEFKEEQQEYRAILHMFYDAEGQIRTRIDTTARFIEVYSNAIAVMTETTKKIEGVIGELSTKSFWRRSGQSIEWNELSNVVVDLRQFVKDVYAGLLGSLSFEHVSLILYKIFAVIVQPMLLLVLLLRFAVIMVIFLLLQSYMPRLIGYLLAGSSSLRILLGILAQFIFRYLASLYAWTVLFIIIQTCARSHPYLAILFYLFSILYVLIMFYGLNRYFVEQNRKYDYLFVSASYEKRFTVVLGVLLCASTVLFFLREAFLRGNYLASEVPTTLLAINYIVLQVALMSLMSRQLIVNAIPRHTPLWEWAQSHVRDYYYVLWLCIIAIIIMSNPYVGYGRQVLYVLSRLGLTALLVPLFFWIHSRVKRVSSDLFFYYAEGEVFRERFSSARVWYGLFVVVSFFIFVVTSLIVIASIWDQALTLRDISEWLRYELWSPGFDETGKRIQITGISLFKIVFAILSGVILTYIINHVVLRRIFDPLMVGSGVQNTILTLTRYVVIALSVLIGLQSAGLDAMTTKVAVLLSALGFALKDPLVDFLSYFIILVQRPIKIGDLIMLEDNTPSVVRHITPRAVILRRRNSVTVIVPNSHIITRTLINWSYTRSFFAFNDMFITVPYTTDPAQVCVLILKVLDTSINVLKTPAPVVWLHDFTDNGFQFLVRGYLTADKVLDQWEISSQIRLEIVRNLRLHAIEIASPTRFLKIAPSVSSSLEEKPQ
jgi:small-conductance mechanosensitive channel